MSPCWIAARRMATAQRDVAGIVGQDGGIVAEGMRVAVHSRRRMDAATSVLFDPVLYLASLL